MDPKPRLKYNKQSNTSDHDCVSMVAHEETHHVVRHATPSLGGGRADDHVHGQFKPLITLAFWAFIALC